MGKLNLKGLKVGFLEVISKSEKDERSGTYWTCKCHCPECTKRRTIKYVSIRQDKLLEGRTLSCGYQKDLQKTRAKKETNSFKNNTEYYIGYTYKGEEFWFDLEDYELVTTVSKSWFFNDGGYLIARDMRDNAPKYKDGRRKIVHLKDVVMNKQHGEKVFYIDNKSKYDNRKSNLKKQEAI